VAAPGTAERAQWRRIFGASSSEKPSAESPEKSAVVPAETSNTSMSVEALVQQATQAVVMIIGMSKPLGSGFLVSPDGTIVTNYHVIKGSEGLGVRFSQDKEVITNISVVKTDPVRDIAIIKVNVPINAAPLPLGDSDQLSAGERVVAIGNPFGLQNTVSDGLVSAVRDFQGVKQIQFSAPISPGSSGGALLNMRGEVVGITSSHVTGEAQNLCFAVPINYVKEDLQ